VFPTHRPTALFAQVLAPDDQPGSAALFVRALGCLLKDISSIVAESASYQSGRPSFGVGVASLTVTSARSSSLVFDPSVGRDGLVRGRVGLGDAEQFIASGPASG
jgi:hypothetical protein